MQGKRIFQIGFGRCGTTTLFHFFERNGVPAIHLDRGNIARRLMARKAAGEDPFLGYPGIVFFSDMGDLMRAGTAEAYKEFRYIHQFYPDAYFILNVRNVQRWMLSRCNHGRFMEWQKEARGISTTEALLRFWAEDWHRHVNDVRAFFADKPGQLLVFDIEKDDPNRLVEFLRADFDLDARHYGSSNESPTRKRFTKLPHYLVPPITIGR
jgi:hypothetical protein